MSTLDPDHPGPSALHPPAASGVARPDMAINSTTATTTTTTDPIALARTCRETFAARGIRWSRQREAVFAALASSASHPSAEELCTMVGSHTPALGAAAGDEPMSLATVYNALEAFVDAGLARRLSGLAGGPARYDADTSNHVHATLPDGRLVDVPKDLSAALVHSLGRDGVLDAIAAHFGLHASSVSVALRLGGDAHDSATHHAARDQSP
jgi:Fur family peroxide stress response transcriptional regulator